MKDATSDLREQTVFTYKGVTYVPHYTKPGVFVGPGYPRHDDREHTLEFMKAIGAQAEAMMLSPRMTVNAKALA
jgi:hypothetical protein